MATFTYDGHGINLNGERILTFQRKHKDDGGDYVLDPLQRDFYGHLIASELELLVQLGVPIPLHTKGKL